MKKIKFKIGMKVYDSWWPWQHGKVTKVLKTRIKVLMSGFGFGYDTKEVTYDKSHQQFLRVK